MTTLTFFGLLMPGTPSIMMSFNEMHLFKAHKEKYDRHFFVNETNIVHARAKKKRKEKKNKGTETETLP